MQFIIVADDDLEDIGRRMAHAIAKQGTYDGSFWTLKYYKDNEAQLQGSQPVIFLGENEITKALTEDIPTRFERYGTRCWYDGSKAILVAEDARFSIDEISDANGELQAKSCALRSSELFLREPAGFLFLGSRKWSLGRVVAEHNEYKLDPARYSGFIGYATRDFQEVDRLIDDDVMRKFQYEYVANRFIVGEMDQFVSEVRRAWGERDGSLS